MSQAIELSVAVASKDPLDVRSYVVRDALNELFSVSLVATSPNHQLLFEDNVGRSAAFTVRDPRGRVRTYQGVLSNIDQVGVSDDAGEQNGLARYSLTIVPKLWLLAGRRNHRLFQATPDPEIVVDILGEWGIEHELRLAGGPYRAREMRVQYGESDLDFVRRLLEESGISFSFASSEGSKLILADAPQSAEPRGERLAWASKPLGRVTRDFATEVMIARATRPGRYVQRDWDQRIANAPAIESEREEGLPEELRLERFHYALGALKVKDGPGLDYPVNDERGKFRPDPALGDAQVEARLASKRAESVTITLRTNALDVAPGTVLVVDGHPRADLGEPLLVYEARIAGHVLGDPSFEIIARPAALRCVPEQRSTKPRVMGVEPATVVGKPGQEIDVDELGRVRVQFHWDREHAMDEDSSAWVPVSQAWAGPGYGLICHPRVGHEVLVDFLAGDPEAPIVVGRIHTVDNPVIYPLVQCKTMSGWKSDSSIGHEGNNELMFEDKLGHELVRLQAQRDETTLIKRDAGVVIRRDSSSHVGRDQTHTVIGNQTLRVKKRRRIRVEENQQTFVDKECYRESLRESSVARAKVELREHASEASLYTVSPPRGTVQSFLAILPDRIVIQSPLVDINPGVGPQPPPPAPDPLSRAQQRFDYFFGAPEEDGQRGAS